MKVHLTRPEQVALLWPKVGEFVRAAMAEAAFNLWDEWDIKKALITGQWFLWLAAEGDEIHAAVVTRVADYPRARLYEVPYIGGRRLADWVKPMCDAIEGHARMLGASAMQGFGRGGWCRVAGYREAYRTFVKDLP